MDKGSPDPGQSFEFSITTVNPSSSTPISQNAAERSRNLSFVQKKRRLRESKKPAEKWTQYSSCMLLDQPSSAHTSPSPPPSSSSFTSSSRPLAGTNTDGSSFNAANVVSGTVQLPWAGLTSPSAGFENVALAARFSSTFSTGTMTSEEYMRTLLRFATKSPQAAFLAEAFAPPSVATTRRLVRHSVILEERQRRFVEDSAFRFSTLAYASSCLAWSAGILDKGKPPEHFLDLALRSVRERFSSHQHTIDDWALLSVFTLVIVQSWNEIPQMWTLCPTEYVTAMKGKGGPNSSPMMHLRALLDMVNQAGGWTKFDPYLLESCILADKYGAIRDNRMPLLDTAWDPGAVPPHMFGIDSRLQTSSLPRLGENLLQVPMSSQIRSVLEETIDYIRIAHDAWRHDASVGRDLESWLFLRLHAVVFRFMSLSDLLGQDECIRLATVISLQNAKSEHSAQVAAQFLAERLRAALISSSLLDESFGQDDLRFWLLCTGAMTAHHSPTRDWFLIMLDLKFPGLEMTQPAFSDRLETFLYLSDRHAGKLQDMVNNLSSFRL
ncbi:hypothetical protein QBC43DRAFT_291883 [Cladorrhinum sp. PSN259]|nr:hypothetical protein QBC43DRAFT_291883 [Cladorrhinum sp. PSN259]